MGTSIPLHNTEMIVRAKEKEGKIEPEEYKKVVKRLGVQMFDALH